MCSRDETLSFDWIASCFNESHGKIRQVLTKLKSLILENIAYNTLRKSIAHVTYTTDFHEITYAIFFEHLSSLID